MLVVVGNDPRVDETQPLFLYSHTPGGGSQWGPDWAKALRWEDAGVATRLAYRVGGVALDEARLRAILALFERTVPVVVRS